MNVTLELKRTYYPEGTLGALMAHNEGGGVRNLVTLELPWKDNHRRESCIPEGTYKVQAIVHEKFRDCFRVPGVKDRDGVLVHRGNFTSDTKGCILIGKAVNEKYKGLAILRSNDAMEELQEFCKDATSITLIITRADEQG